MVTFETFYNGLPVFLAFVGLLWLFYLVLTATNEEIEEERTYEE